jgi:Myb-like DNA-binding protein FlbD
MHMMDDQNRRGPWSQREDEILMDLVKQQGALNWVKISQMLTSRTPKQCRERYHQNLKPNLNHDPITAAEGALIEAYVGQLGKRWAEIARRLENRSDNAVKNWWNGSMNRRKRMHSKRRPGYPESIDTTSSYPRTPAPLQVPTYSSYSSYPALSPASPPGRYTTHWSNHSGLPSPTAASPGFGSPAMDGAPSLMSDRGSHYSTSPTTTGLPDSPTNLELPPMRQGDYKSPSGSYHFELGPKLPSLGDRTSQGRLPRIWDAIENGAQLPTAPNSPQMYSTTSIQTPALREPSRDKDSRMELNRLLQ